MYGCLDCVVSAVCVVNMYYGCVSMNVAVYVYGIRSKKGGVGRSSRCVYGVKSERGLRKIESWWGKD